MNKHKSMVQMDSVSASSKSDIFKQNQDDSSGLIWQWRHFCNSWPFAPLFFFHLLTFTLLCLLSYFISRFPRRCHMWTLWTVSSEYALNQSQWSTGNVELLLSHPFGKLYVSRSVRFFFGLCAVVLPVVAIFDEKQNAKKEDNISFSNTVDKAISSNPISFVPYNE